MTNPILLILMVLLQATVFAQTQPQRTGKYLGEQAPGITPIIFAPDFISLPTQHEFGSIFSANGQECYYAVDRDGKAEIRYTRLNKGQWTTPVTILSDKVYSYNDPMLSPDESKLFFISDRSTDSSGKKKDYDIWYVQKNGNRWSAPVNAGPAINSSRHEYYVSFAKNGTMYFSSNKHAEANRTNNFDIYAAPSAQTGFQQPLRLDETINTGQYEADVFVAADESYIIFSAAHTDGHGAGDLYISFRKADGSWSNPKNMGDTINTPGHELCPFVTADGKYLFYTSRQDIYWVDAKVIDTFR